MNDNDDIKLNTSKQILLSVLGLAILLVAVVGISFAAFNYTKAGVRENTIKTGTVSMSYNEATNGINIQNATPMSEADALAAYTGNLTYVENVEGTYNYRTPEDEDNPNTSVSDNVFDFTVSLTTKGTSTASYDVTAVKDATKTCNDTVYTNVAVAEPSAAALAAYADCHYVSDSDIRLWLGKYNSSSSATTEDGKYEAVAIPNKTTGNSYTSSAWVSYPSNGETAPTANGTPLSTASDNYMVLYSGDITAASNNGVETTTQHKFRLKMWVDTAYKIDGNPRSYTVKVNVYAKS